MATYTAESICNEAIVIVGGSPILSFTEMKKEAQLCRTLYPRILDEVTRSAQWNHAINKVVLSPLTETFENVSRYSFKYPLPLDCLRPLTVNEDRQGIDHCLWDVEGRFLVTNEASVRLKYIKRETNASLFDSTFVSALIYRLAQELAFPLMQNQNMVQLYKSLFDECVRGAKSLNTFAGTVVQNWSDNTFEKTRW